MSNGPRLGIITCTSNKCKPQPGPTILWYSGLSRSSPFRLSPHYPPKQSKGLKMNALKAVQAFPPSISFRLQAAKLPKRTKSIICCGSSSSEGNGTESEEPSPPDEAGDKRKQELLAKIAMLQAQKVRLTDYLDERSAFLTKFAEDANAEFESIGEDALRGLDEAEARIMESIESRMRAFEERAEMNKQEIEKNDQILKDFEAKIEKDRNEGLFFKNLRERKPQEQAKSQEEIQKLRELTKDNAGSKVRRNIYLALISLLAATIANSVISSPELEWRKIASLGLILVALVAQFLYEQKMSSDTQKTEEEE